MTGTRPSPPDRDANLAAVDPRLLAELQFPLRLVRPNGMPWLKALLALGEVANDIVPLMTVWMSRWSEVLSYDGTDAPLVHARWAQAPDPVEAAGSTPRPVVARAPIVTQTHSVRMRTHERIIERPVTRAEASTPGSDSARLAVQAQPISLAPPPVFAEATPLAGDVRSPHAGESVVAQAPVARPGPALTPDEGAARVHPPVAAAEPATHVVERSTTTRIESPTSTPVEARPTTRPDAPIVATPGVDVVHTPTSMPHASVPPVHPLTIQDPDAVPVTSPESPVGAQPANAEPATAVAGREAESPSVTTRAAPPSAAEIEALVHEATRGDGPRTRVVSRGVTTRRPDGLSLRPPAIRPAPMSHRRTVSTVDGQTVVARTAPASRGTTRPVVRATVVRHDTPPPISGRPAPSMPAGAVDGLVHATPVVIPSAAHPSGPTPGPSRQVPGFTPVGPPGSAADARRMLGLQSTGASNTTPPPSNAAPSAPDASATPTQPNLSPRQMSTIATVVQDRVIRHLERERERTRTRV